VRFLREQFWIVQVTGLAIVMALAGSAATTVLSMWILAIPPAQAPGEDEALEEEDEEEDEEFVEAPVVKTVASVRAEKQRTIDTILGRNAFCPTCVPETKGPATAAVLADAPMPAGERPPLRLLATMESSDPGYSIATVYNTATQTSGVFGIGDAIMPGTQLLAVRGGTVTVGAGASTHQLRVGEAAAPVAAPKAEPTTEKKEKKAKSSIPARTKPSSARRRPSATSSASSSSRCSRTRPHSPAKPRCVRPATASRSRACAPARCRTCSD
jgi:general secretion pathway protein C